MTVPSSSVSSRFNWISIDVSKANLDVYEHQSGQSQRFRNDHKGIAKLLKWASQFPHPAAVFESTGGLERLAAETFSSEGILSMPLRTTTLPKPVGRLPKPTALMRAPLPTTVTALSQRLWSLLQT